MCDISLGIFTGVVFWLTKKRIAKIWKKKNILNKLMCVTQRQEICEERKILTCVNLQL